MSTLQSLGPRKFESELQGSWRRKIEVRARIHTR
jgi:hypothetical protein